MEGVLPVTSEDLPVQDAVQTTEKLSAKAIKSPDQMSIMANLVLPDKSIAGPHLAVPQHISSRQAGRPKIDYRALNNPPPCKPSSSEANMAVDYAYTTMDNLSSINEAESHEDWKPWKGAMSVKLDQLLRLGTYILTECPPDCKPIRCK